MDTEPRIEAGLLLPFLNPRSSLFTASRFYFRQSSILRQPRYVLNG